jgi:hypothetical protein
LLIAKNLQSELEQKKAHVLIALGFSSLMLRKPCNAKSFGSLSKLPNASKGRELVCISRLKTTDTNGESETD